MFYNQLIKICEERNEKPTPLLKALGFSATNLKRWQNGATVNSDILAKLSKHFEVPVDYFFLDDEDENDVSSKNTNAEFNTFKMLYNIIKSHPDHVVSLMTEKTITRYDLEKIANYLDCSPDCLIKGNLIKENLDVLNDNITPKDLVLNVLSKLAASDEYRYLQVSISIIIIGNLKKKNITLNNLIEMGLVEKKLRNLHNIDMPDEKKTGLNYSDLMNISEKFNLSYDFMLTGKDS